MGIRNLKKRLEQLERQAQAPPDPGKGWIGDSPDVFGRHFHNWQRVLGHEAGGDLDRPSLEALHGTRGRRTYGDGYAARFAYLFGVEGEPMREPRPADWLAALPGPNWRDYLSPAEFCLLFGIEHFVADGEKLIPPWASSQPLLERLGKGRQRALAEAQRRSDGS